MQSTALALISCDQTRNKVVYPQVPRYDAIIYCDLGCEPAWVADQVRFIERACVDCNIPFYILQSNLYQDYMQRFGRQRVSAMPFWTLDEQGKAGRIARRSCTVDYKVLMIQKFVRYELLATGPISGFAQRISAPMNSTSAFPVKRLIVPFPADTLCFKTDFRLSRWVGNERTATPIIWMSGAWTARPAPA